MEDDPNADSTRHELVIDVVGGSSHYVEIPGVKDFDSTVKEVFTKASFKAALPSYCLTRDNITDVYLRGNNGNNWLVASVATYYAGSDEKYYPLTEDLDRYKFLQNSNKIFLTRFQEPVEGCIQRLLIAAQTGRDISDRFRVPERHHIIFTLINGSQLTATMRKPAPNGKPYATTLSFAAVSEDCVRVSDIKTVHLQDGSEDGWYISSFAISVQVGRDSLQTLTEDPTVNSWVDSDGFDKGHRKSVDLCMYKKFAFFLPSHGNWV